MKKITILFTLSIFLILMIYCYKLNNDYWYNKGRQYGQIEVLCYDFCLRYQHIDSITENFICPIVSKELDNLSKTCKEWLGD